MSEGRARVAITISRWVDDHQPGVVECSLVDAFGKEWRFIEKAPVVSGDDLWRDSDYPRAGYITCRVVKAWSDNAGRRIVRVNTDEPWHVEAASGDTVFDVLENQVELVAE